MARTVFRFADRQEAEADRHLVELRDGKHYRLRTGARDQPGDRAVRIHELAERVRGITEATTPEELVAAVEAGDFTAADTRLAYQSIRELVGLMFFEDIPDDVLQLHGMDDLSAIVEQYFLLWPPPAPEARGDALVASQI